MSTDNKPLPQCDCLNHCGDDPAVRNGKAQPCQNRLDWEARKAQTAKQISIDPRWADIDFDKVNAELRDLRAQVGRLQAHIDSTQPVVAGADGYVQPLTWTGVNVDKLLKGGMKPEDIAGEQSVQHARVQELLHWFVRLADGNANPKWTREHAFELAYYIATTSAHRIGGQPAAPVVAEPVSEPDKDARTWCEYVAGMIGCYLNEPVDSDKCKAITRIIECRLWALPASKAPAQKSVPCGIDIGGQP